MSLVVSFTVVTDNPPDVIRATEVLGRAATGLVLEGISVSITLGQVEDDEAEVEEPSG